MKLLYSWIIPKIKTVSESNCSENHYKKHIRHKDQKLKIWAYYHKEKPNIKLPIIIWLTRIAPRSLDQHDNLPMSLKWIVDALADCIIPGLKPGRADDSKEISWVYNQEKGKPKEYALRIEIFKDE